MHSHIKLLVSLGIGSYDFRQMVNCARTYPPWRQTFEFVQTFTHLVLGKECKTFSLDIHATSSNFASSATMTGTFMALSEMSQQLNGLS